MTVSEDIGGRCWRRANNLVNNLIKAQPNEQFPEHISHGASCVVWAGRQKAQAVGSCLCRHYVVTEFVGDPSNKHDWQQQHFEFTDWSYVGLIAAFMVEGRRTYRC